MHMNKSEILSNYLKNYKNGTIIKLGYHTDYYSANGHAVTKYTLLTYKRLGVEYGNIKGVINKHEGLKGDQTWISKYLIKNNKTGEIKLRVSNLQNMKNLKSTTIFVDENGNKYNSASEIDFLPESKKHPKYNGTFTPVMDIKLENLDYVGDLNLR